MSKVFLTADLHFGHKKIHLMRDQFSSETHHTESIISNWNSVVTKKDTVIVLGDVAFNKDGLDKIKLLNGSKILVMGNHDKLKKVNYLDYFDRVLGVMGYKGYWLSHVPVHPDHIRGSEGINIHGHLHADTMNDDRYICVCLEHTNYSPILFSALG